MMYLIAGKSGGRVFITSLILGIICVLAGIPLVGLTPALILFPVGGGLAGLGLGKFT